MIDNEAFKKAKSLEYEISQLRKYLADIEKGKVAPVVYEKKFGGGYEWKANGTTNDICRKDIFKTVNKIAKDAYTCTIKDMISLKEGDLSRIVNQSECGST